MPSPTGQASDTHAVDELGMEHWIEDGLSYGRAAILPGMLVPDTDIVRIGVLAILTDMVAGQPSRGAVTPTTDISVHVARLIPMSVVQLKARVLKAGATLLVAETMLSADDDSAPFATSLATFMNRPVESHARQPPIKRLDEPFGSRIGARLVAPGTVELDARDDVGNRYHHGTVQGGVIATLIELATASSFGEEPYLVTDIDVRFLNRVKQGPVRAVAELLFAGPPEWRFGVTVTDRGLDDRIVAYATTSCRPTC
jgi:acyl-coenzyme A thioesterase PaaI-like protein